MQLTNSDDPRTKKGKTLLIYGLPGIGKTPFAAQFPKPLLLDCEAGIESIRTKGVEIATIERWSDVMQANVALNAIKDSKITLLGKELTVETVIVDTIGELGRTIMASALLAAGKETPKFDEWNLAIERTRATLRSLQL